MTTKTLYLDLFSGISGDMFIGALLDLGVDANRLERELHKLKLDGYHIHVARRLKSGIEGVKFDVHLSDDHEHHHPHDHPRDGHHSSRITQHPTHPAHPHHRSFGQIQRLISRSKLSPWVKQKSIAVFRRIAEAEGKIHGLPPHQVHFHEVGAVDSLVDIVGASVALALLGQPRVLASPVVEGTGWVDCAHGRFPVPTPATLAILGARGIGVTQCDEPNELVTPTGAALLAEFAESFGPMDRLAAEKIGFGLGSRDNRTRPNLLRAILGTNDQRPRRDELRESPNIVSPATPHLSHLDWETDRVAVLETNLDDISSQVLGHFVELALAAGALDVFYTPIQMKKNRPGVLLTILCAEADADKFSEMILQETSAFGLRRAIAERRKLRRAFTTVKTRFGPVTVKLGRLGGKIVQAAPEYESCRKLAAKAGVPLKNVYDAALKPGQTGA